MTTATAPATVDATPVVPDRGIRRPHWVHIGPRLRALREETHLSQKALAALTKEVDPRKRGLSSYSLNRYESATHAPRPAAAALVAKTLSKVLGRPITTDDLRMRGREGLGLYLENVRTEQGRTKADFYGDLWIDVRRADRLVAGDDEWTLPELRRIYRRYGEAADLIQSVVLGIGEDGAVA